MINFKYIVRAINNFKINFFRNLILLALSSTLVVLFMNCSGGFQDNFKSKDFSSTSDNESDIGDESFTGAPDFSSPPDSGNGNFPSSDIGFNAPGGSMPSAGNNTGSNTNSGNNSGNVINNSIVVTFTELAGTYKSEKNLVDKASQLNFSNCIRLENSKIIYNGFAPCVDVYYNNPSNSPVVIGPDVPSPQVPKPQVPSTGGAAPIGSANCPIMARNVSIVDTGLLENRFPQKVISPNNGQEIYAFKISVGTNGISESSFRATKTTAGKSRYIVISECPGDFDNPINGNIRACTRFSVESSRVYLTSNASKDPRTNCVLKPGRIYYANVLAKESPESQSYLCDSKANCSFYAARE